MKLKYMDHNSDFYENVELEDLKRSAYTGVRLIDGDFVQKNSYHFDVSGYAYDLIGMEVFKDIDEAVDRINNKNIDLKEIIVKRNAYGVINFMHYPSVKTFSKVTQAMFNEHLMSDSCSVEISAFEESEFGKEEWERFKNEKEWFETLGVCDSDVLLGDFPFLFIEGQLDNELKQATKEYYEKLDEEWEDY